MADNSRPVAEPLQKGAQAAQAVRGAVKTGKAIAGAAKGAAAGGVWGAVAGKPKVCREGHHCGDRRADDPDPHSVYAPRNHIRRLR